MAKIADVTRISDTLRQRMQDQKQSMTTGLIIDNKGLKKVRLRILPCGEDMPGAVYRGMFSAPLNKGCTSPRTFDLPDPVLDMHEHIKRTGNKEEKKHAYDTIRPYVEYWMAVLDRSNVGTAAKPNTRIFRAKQTVYKTLIEAMENSEDYGVFLNLTKGRDIRVVKTDEQNPWKVLVLDPSPVFDDPKDIPVFLKAVAGFEVAEHFYKVNLAHLREMYDALTGEALPAEIMEQLEASEHCYWPDDEEGKTARPSARVGGARKPVKPVKPAADVAEEPEEAEAAEAAEEPEEAGEIAKGAKVAFKDDDGNEVEGTVLSVNAKDKTAKIDTPENTWTVGLDDLTRVADEAEAEEAAEPEAEAEEEPAKPAATSKSKPKARAEEGEEPAGEEEAEEPEEVEEEAEAEVEEPAAKATPRVATPKAPAKAKPAPKAKPAAKGGLRGRIASARK